MIAAPPGVRVLVATRPVDFRRGADSLAAMVREQLRQDPFCGTLFASRRRAREHALLTLCIGAVPRPELDKELLRCMRIPTIADGQSN